MRPTSPASTFAISLLVLGALAGCDRSFGGDGGPGGGTAAGAAPRPQYVREYVFLGARQGEPLVVPFAFRATDGGEDGVRRQARAWLARGASWEEILEESWSGSTTAGVWRVVPRGDLRVAARAPSEVDALWFEEGDRPLRLQVGSPLSGWAQGDDARFRVQQGRLALGEEVVAGAVLTLLEVDRAGRGPRGADPADWIFLTSGDSLRLVIARLGGARDRFGTSLGWTGRPDGERAWDMVEIDWLETRPFRAAGRNIPTSWRFGIPGAGVRGEVRALGFETVVGAERGGGRRAVEVRYTVDGWVQVDGRRSRVQGTVRHSQR